MRNIFAINGSASSGSSNEQLIRHFAHLTKDCFEVTFFDDLKTLPPSDPVLSVSDTPKAILDFQNQVSRADGILICTPEYIFSIPAGLKNALEWCVSTTVFSDKPIGLITAAASGQKAHTELQLIMRTLMARFTDQTTLLIPGIKGKINEQGNITDPNTLRDLDQFVAAYKTLLPFQHCSG